MMARGQKIRVGGAEFLPKMRVECTKRGPFSAARRMVFPVFVIWKHFHFLDLSIYTFGRLMEVATECRRSGCRLSCADPLPRLARGLPLISETNRIDEGREPVSQPESRQDARASRSQPMDKIPPGSRRNSQQA